MTPRCSYQTADGWLSSIRRVCHSYRRGKPTVHDVDLIITFPHRAGAEVNVLELLLHRLDRKGARHRKIRLLSS